MTMEQRLSANRIHTKEVDTSVKSCHWSLVNGRYKKKAGDKETYKRWAPKG